MAKRRSEDLDTRAAVLKVIEPSADLAAACKEYQNRFLKITLLHQLGKCSAFKAFTDLNTALETPTTPEFSATFTAEVPIEISEHVLSWMKKGVQEVAQIPFDKTLLATFIHVSKREQFLKDTMRFSQAVVLATKAKQKPLSSVCEISPTQFSEIFTETAASTPAPSHEEVVARDNQRLKELEKINREKRAQQALATSTQALSAQLKQQNEQKQNEAKAAQKETLLQKIGELGNRQQETLANFLDPENEAHKTFDEETMCGILTNIGILEKTTKGFKIQLNHTTTSSHRSHDGKLDGHFCRDVREIFADLGITPNTIGARPNPETVVSRKQWAKVGKGGSTP